jgi:hypothetical protein
MCIRICMQDEFIDLCSNKVFEDIGGLRCCKSLAPNRWGVFELGSTPAKDKLSILMKECNLVENPMKTGQNII